MLQNQNTEQKPKQCPCPTDKANKKQTSKKELNKKLQHENDYLFENPNYWGGSGF